MNVPKLTRPIGHEVKRQQATRPPVGEPAMADASGNVVPYNRDGVVSNKFKREAMAQAKRHEMAVKRRSQKTQSRKRTSTPSKSTKRATGSKATKRTTGTKTNKAAKSKKRTVNRH